MGGQGWVGGNWTGAPTLAVDLGMDAVADHLCYVGSIWEGELRLTAKTRTFGDQNILKQKLGAEMDRNNRTNSVNAPPPLEGFDGGDNIFLLGGIATHNGLLVGSLVRQNELIVVEIKSGKVLPRIALSNPRGLAFDSQGRLLALSGSKLVRFAKLTGKPETLDAKGLEDPRHVAVDAAGQIYITDRGTSHQVKVFSAEGKLLRSIGKPGAPTVGPYDPLHLNNPNGLAVDSQGRVWVAEADNYPRRVSVWSDKGELSKSFYGPTEYGGGGVLDPQDSSKFYYKGLEFNLDWKSGTDTLQRVFWRPDPFLNSAFGNYSPDTPLYPEAQKGRRYFTSCYTHTPTNGDEIAFLWQDGEKQARLVAALGDAHAWPILRGAEFRGLWPEGTKPEEENPNSDARASMAWSDANHDGRPQPAEVKFTKGRISGITVMNDLACIVSQSGQHSVRFAAVYESDGLPKYDLSNPDILGPSGGQPQSSGGNQSLTESGGWTIHTNASAPFSPYGIGGVLKGEDRKSVV